MKHGCNRPVLLLASVVVWWMALAVDEAFAKSGVTIKNECPDEIRAHCWSGDDDLQVRIIPPHDSFSWSFRRNIWGTTKFQCRFTRLPGYIREFYVWVDGWVAWPLPACGICGWLVTDNGFSLWNKKAHQYFFIRGWERVNNPGDDHQHSNSTKEPFSVRFNGTTISGLQLHG